MICNMDSQSQETLRRVEENDAELTELLICGAYGQDDRFNSTDGDDFSRLGDYIGRGILICNIWSSY